MKLLFAVADVLDGRGEFSQAAAWLERANALGRDQLLLRGNPYSPADHRRFIDAVIDAFTPALIERLAGAGLDTPRPVFIVGMPRSGTTLIEQILASHAEVHGAGEISLVRQSLEEVSEVMQRTGPQLESVKELLPEHVAELARRHEERLRAIDGGRASRIINKWPENYLYLGLIALMFPRAVVIHCRRDPRDVALSCWASNFVEVRWAYQYDHIATRFSEYRRLMDYWRIGAARLVRGPRGRLRGDGGRPRGRFAAAGGRPGARLGPGVPGIPQDPAPRSERQPEPGASADLSQLGGALETLREGARRALRARRVIASQATNVHGTPRKGRTGYGTPAGLSSR